LNHLTYTDIVIAYGRKGIIYNILPDGDGGALDPCWYFVVFPDGSLDVFRLKELVRVGPAIGVRPPPYPPAPPAPKV
jgi:hypothetical protein